ncbi:MAG: glycosyltransferase family 2 protein [Lachnospiraceae bacterium]|nr:glycosyltransferase family 2 protein [Lachnospiraceae bacterium]
MISVIIVTWNSAEYIEKCIESLFRHSNEDVEVIVIDNDSNDKTTEIVEKLMESRSHIILIKNKENIGFGKANNIGLERARGEYCVFLNPDVFFVDNIFSEMVKILKKDESVGIVSPVLLNADYSVQGFYGKLPTNGLSVIFEEVLIRPLLIHVVLKVKNGRRLIVGKKTKCASIGAAQMIRKNELIDLGGYPDRFFLYAEDIELAMRYERRHKNLYISNNTLIHYGGKSEELAKPGLKVHHMTRNINHLLIRYYGIKKATECIKGYYVSSIIKRCLARILRKSNLVKQYRIYAAAYRRIYDYNTKIQKKHNE